MVQTVETEVNVVVSVARDVELCAVRVLAVMTWVDVVVVAMLLMTVRFDVKMTIEVSLEVSVTMKDLVVSAVET